MYVLHAGCFGSVSCWLQRVCLLLLEQHDSMLLATTAPPTCCLCTAGRKAALRRCLPVIRSKLLRLVSLP